MPPEILGMGVRMHFIFITKLQSADRKMYEGIT